VTLEGVLLLLYLRAWVQVLDGNPVQKDQGLYDYLLTPYNKLFGSVCLIVIKGVMKVFNGSDHACLRTNRLASLFRFYAELKVNVSFSPALDGA
jgi:hypothetical protein